MMTQNDSRAKSLFIEALEITSQHERETYLQAQCGSDDQLRGEVLALLDHEHRLGRFLEGEGDGPNAVLLPTISEQPGTVIGPYTLLEQIGAGGFGVVFLAEQTTPIRRKVALKVIKPGMDTRQVIARFEAERQALALMDHPNIAKIFDAGTTEAGRPYVVMELVQGIPITEYCDECQLTTGDRLELFVTVCQAVQHAHQRGVIHRDLKPTNVLVSIQDGQPAPKIIDFGVAKAIEQRLTDQTLTTEFAQMVGTPTYMSPEQAELSRLGVDTRSDVYSLGVLLYELLAGTTPFDKDRLHAASFDEMRRIIREEDPPRPSIRMCTLAADMATTVAFRRRTELRRLQLSIRGELDWMVMKALDKDRNRRYESAGGLARDIQRYLHDEPVEACSPSVTYRLTKFVRRNKVGALASLAVLLSLLSATGISTVLYLRERESRRQMELAAKIAAVTNPYHNNGYDFAERAIASLTPLLDQMDSQNRAKLYYTMADVRGHEGRWKESATYFAKGLALESDQAALKPWSYYLPVLVQGGELEQYHRARQEILERFGGSSDPHVAGSVLKNCLFIPWQEADFETLDRLADCASHGESWTEFYFDFAKALLEYRRGNYELALLHTRSVLTTASEPYLFIEESMVRAMAYQRLGRRDEARNCLSIGLQYSARLPRETDLFAEQGWNDWIVSRALVNEAVSLIDAASFSEIPKAIAASGDCAAVIGNLYALALEELQSGNISGYQEVCSTLALVPENTGLIEAEMRRTWTWCLGPHSNEDLIVPLARAEQVIATNAFGARYFELLMLGGVLYRMGRYESAAMRLEESIAGYPHDPPSGFGTTVYPRLLLSMARWHLGDKEEARRLLTEIQPEIDRAIATPSTPWKYRTTLNVLRREAEGLTEEKDAAKSVGNTNGTIPGNYHLILDSDDTL